MTKKIAIYASEHKSPPNWSFRRYDPNPDGDLVTWRRKRGYLNVPNHFHLAMVGDYEKRGKPREMTLVRRRKSKPAEKLTVRAAIKRFGVIVEE